MVLEEKRLGTYKMLKKALMFILIGILLSGITNALDIHANEEWHTGDEQEIVVVSPYMCDIAIYHHNTLWYSKTLDKNSENIHTIILRVPANSQDGNHKIIVREYNEEKGDIVKEVVPITIETDHWIIKWFKLILVYLRG